MLLTCRSTVVTARTRSVASHGWSCRPPAPAARGCSAVPLGGGVLPIERRQAGEIRCGAKLREPAAAPHPPATLRSQGVERRSFGWSYLGGDDGSPATAAAPAGGSGRPPGCGWLPRAWP